MRRAQVLSGVLVASSWFTACLPAGRSAPSTSAPDASAPTSSPSAEPAQSVDPSVVTVPAAANIFGAGHDQTPSPGGGGGGTLPPEWPLPGGGTRVVTFRSVSGEVNPINNEATVGYNGPGGDMTSDTDVESYGGIAGLIHHGNGMFLVGVFLTDATPADPAPVRLDFTDGEQFDRLEPRIGQTFFIGDGVGRQYLVPPDATRLFLGFVNAYTRGDPLSMTHGSPGYYGNNSGELEVRVEVSVD